MQFNLTDEQLIKIAEFRKEQNEKRGSDYYGAAGGDLTYLFTPTDIGCVVKVEHPSGDVLDISDYEDW